ncbi:MAG: hypothetical protein Q7J16_06340 [Candidatus Cloacimonadales bacterium]|nr:hypothetical protein [Candidatus Cloacimonadales bacterium]
MKKVILVISLMIISMILMALNQKVHIKANEIELKFENVKIKNIKFYSGKDVEIDYTDQEVTVGKQDNLITISSDDLSKISVKLPENKKYILHLEEGKICKFDIEQVEFTGDDGEILRFKDGTLTVMDNNEKTIVTVGADGIYVDDEDEHVEISNKGIIVEGEDNTELTGFWGQLLGGFVRTIVKTSINYIGKSPERIVKYLVNHEAGDTTVSINWGDDENDLAEKEIHETFTPQKGDKLDVSNQNGNIEISGWDNKEVDVIAKLKSRRGEKEFDDVQIEVKKEDNWLINTEHLKKNPKVSVSYIIKVPSELLLGSLETTNGSIELTDVSGDISLRSSNGSLEINNVNGTIDAFTSNGSIDVENVSGKVNVTTSNASISAENVKNLKNCITSNASITAKVEEINNDLLFSTSNARINLYLNSKIDAEIVATTSNADINLRDIKINTESVSKSKFEGTLGKGGFKITASTSNARINLNGIK